MKFRMLPTCLICSIPLMVMPASTTSAAGCPGQWIPGKNCVCPDGSEATTQDLQNWYCPNASQPRNRATPTHAKAPSDRSAEKARRAVRDEAGAEKELAAAQKTEQRSRKMLDDAKQAQEAAKKTLSDANKKLDALQKQADATSDPQSKLKILQQQLQVKKAMLPVISGRDQMRASVSNLQDKLKTAEQATANARARLAQATQARVAAVAERSPATQLAAQSASQSKGLPKVSTVRRGGTQRDFSPTLNKVEPVTLPSRNKIVTAIPSQASNNTSQTTQSALSTLPASPATSPSAQSAATLTSGEIDKITQPDSSRFYKDSEGLTGSCVAYAKNVYANMTGKEIGRVGTAANMINYAKSNGLPYLSGSTDPRSVPYPSLVVWGATPKNSAGHVAVITAVRGDTVIVKEANFGPNMLQDGTFRTDNYGLVTETTMSIKEFQSRSGANVLGYITQ